MNSPAPSPSALRGVVVGSTDPALAGLILGGLPLAERARLALADVVGADAVTTGVTTGVAADGAVVLHDAHCPATPAASLRAVLADAVPGVGDGACAVGVRPVTDTVKTVHVAGGGEWLGETVDREALVAVTSPLVVPAEHAALLALAPDLDDLPGTVAWLRERVPMRMVQVEARSRRVVDRSDVVLLEALAGEESGLR